MIPKIAPASSPKNQGASWSIARTAVQKPDSELTEVNRITLLGQRLNNLNKWLTRSRCPAGVRCPELTRLGPMRLLNEDECPLLALSGHFLLHRECPLSRVKRT